MMKSIIFWLLPDDRRMGPGHRDGVGGNVPACLLSPGRREMRRQTGRPPGRCFCRHQTGGAADSSRADESMWKCSASRKWDFLLAAHRKNFSVAEVRADYRERNAAFTSLHPAPPVP